MGRLAPCVIALLLAAAAGPARADYLVLADGRRIEGKILSESAKEVRIKTSVGELAFPRGEVRELKREATRDEVYAERLAACKTAEDYHQLGLWCEGEKLKKRAQEHYEKAVALDPDHAGARAKLGFVSYAGRWMTPAERDAVLYEEHAAEMRAKGLVEHAGEWVTPADKAKLEQGLVRVDGVWITRAEELEKHGLAEFHGERMPRERALALAAAEEFAALAPVPVRSHVGSAAVLIGTLPEAELKQLDAALLKTCAWFYGAYGEHPPLSLFDGRLPEFYVFGIGTDAAYTTSVDWAVGRSQHVAAGWPDAVRKTLGFTWIDPLAISSARQGPRGPVDLSGHCYHHMGHLLLERLGFDGKLLPPWYVEGVAALAELRTHGLNKVFCRSTFTFGVAEGTASGGEETVSPVTEEEMDNGSWRGALHELLAQGRARPFDRLAQLEFSQLQLIDIAQSMAIVEWLESRPGALPAFHRELRARAPTAPARVLTVPLERHAAYDAAFKAAAGLDFRAADAEWRKWFLSR
jgi:hypothetical protein